VPVAAAPSPPPAPVTRAAAPSRPAERTARRASPPPAKPKPRPKTTSVTKKAQATTPPVSRSPHDTIRLGLPIATLTPLDEDSAASAGLLLAAAVLLAATGAGGLVVGLSARRIVSGA
ncbi:MAG TPA: hypothetical protein VJM49_20535, partial [Acidimicrobiales bacterium]|nr:hypothetical protein [Acidimicrobiales bacterium]